MKILAGIIGGLIIAIIGAIVIAVGGASKPSSGGSYGAIAFFVLWAVGIFVALKAPSVAKAWRRLLITSGVLSFFLPLSAILFTGSHVAGTLEKGGEYAGAAAAGAAVREVSTGCPCVSTMEQHDTPSHSTHSSFPDVGRAGVRAPCTGPRRAA